MTTTKDFINEIADEIHAEFEKKFKAEARTYTTELCVGLVHREFNDDIMEIYKHLKAIENILEMYEIELPKRKQEKLTDAVTYIKEKIKKHIDLLLREKDETIRAGLLGSFKAYTDIKNFLETK